jgi:hypothetical protein
MRRDRIKRCVAESIHEADLSYRSPAADSIREPVARNDSCRARQTDDVEAALASRNRAGPVRGKIAERSRDTAQVRKLQIEVSALSLMV